MGCTIPTTRSAGFIFLDYTHVTQGLSHRTHVRLSQTADPLDPITMAVEANTWSGQLQACLCPDFEITGWGTQDIDGAGLLQLAFPASLTGTHVRVGGAEDYKARTLTITGRGVPAIVGLCKGPALSRMFIGSSLNFVPGQRFLSAGIDAAFDGLAQEFQVNSVIWFDYYGQKAGVRTTYPTQFHAYIQRRHGQ